MAPTIRSRYYGLPVREVGGRPSLPLRQMPSPLDPSETVVHTVVGGETLDQIAWTYYGREDLWWRIADANPGRFPLDWRPGDRLLIPPLSAATRTPRR